MREGVHEHGNTESTSSFLFIYSACLARRDRDRSGRVAGQSAIGNQRGRALLSGVDGPGSTSSDHVVGVGFQPGAESIGDLSGQKGKDGTEDYCPVVLL